MAAEIETQDAAHLDVLVADRREPSRHRAGMITGRGVDHRLDAMPIPGYDDVRQQDQGAQKAEILAMLAAGRASAEIAGIFRVHRTIISRVIAEARTVSLKTEAAPDSVAPEVAAQSFLSKS